MLSGSSHFTAGRSEVASALARPAALRSRKIPRSGGRVRAERKQQAPLPDVPKQKRRGGGGREWLQQLLSKFGPMTDRSPNTFVMDFEKPLVELDNRIREVRPDREGGGLIRVDLAMEDKGRGMCVLVGLMLCDVGWCFCDMVDRSDGKCNGLD